MANIQALSALRHTCLGCGGSCEGVRVSIFPEEQAPLELIGGQLGIESPIVEGRVRQVEGRCVFLNERNHCRIHAEIGPDQKPRTCKQYPIVLVKTEGGLRAGIDPGCYTAFQTWRNSPEIDVEAYGAAEAVYEEDAIQQERALLRLLLAPETSFTRMLRALCPGEPDEIGLPVGLRERWVSRWSHPDIPRLLQDEHTGPALRRGLEPLWNAAPSWQEAPKSLPSPEHQAWALEVCRRMIFLRLLRNYPPQAVALLTLLGALSAQWGSPDQFPQALSAWVRALRAPRFWASFAADPRELMWLATGVRP